MMLLAMRRKVVRVSERDWPRKSLREESQYYWICAGEWSGAAYDLAFVDVAGLVEEGVHCGCFEVVCVLLKVIGMAREYMWGSSERASNVAWICRLDFECTKCTYFPFPYSCC